MLSPRESGLFIEKNADHIKIDDEGVKRCAEELARRVNAKELSLDKLFDQMEILPTDGDQKSVDWIFFSDVLNFSFWSLDSDTQYVVNYKGEKYTGYLSMCAAINRTLDQGIDLTNPTFYKDITEAQLDGYLKGENGVSCPMIPERVACLKEVAKVLSDKYSGSFVNVVKQCDKSAVRLLQMIQEEFPCFRDVAQFKCQDVSLMKRAQILVADVWSFCKGQGYGDFKDISQMTMFADYRVPQSLQYFGAMKYSQELMECLKSDQLMINGSPMEVEIRGCSIAAVDRVVKEANKILGDEDKVNDILTDYFLWGFRREKREEMEKFPYHKVRSIYY